MHSPARPCVMRVWANRGLQIARYWLAARSSRASELAQRDRITGTRITTTMKRQCRKPVNCDHNSRYYTIAHLLLWLVQSHTFYSAPVGERRIAISLSVCLCVYLSASISLEPLERSSRNFLCRSPVAVARSCSSGVAIWCVLPILWTTSRLAVMGRMAIAALRHRGGVSCLWMPCYPTS